MTEEHRRSGLISPDTSTHSFIEQNVVTRGRGRGGRTVEIGWGREGGYVCEETDVEWGVIEPEEQSVPVWFVAGLIFYIHIGALQRKNQQDKIQRLIIAAGNLRTKICCSLAKLKRLR